MINSEVIQRVQSLYSKGVQSDDTRLADRHIYNKMITTRVKLLVQKANKKQKLSQWNFQTIPCVELVEAPAHECPCLPPIGCKILKSKFPLPRPLTSLNGHLIQSVTSIEGSIIYSEVTWREKKYKSGSKYTQNKLDYFIRNDYLYLTHRDGPEIVAVTAPFENPLDAEAFPSACQDTNCTDCVDCESYLEKEFPLDNGLVDTLVEMAANELIERFNRSLEDQRNDSRDTEEQRSK